MSSPDDSTSSGGSDICDDTVAAVTSHRIRPSRVAAVNSNGTVAIDGDNCVDVANGNDEEEEAATTTATGAAPAECGRKNAKKQTGCVEQRQLWASRVYSTAAAAAAAGGLLPTAAAAAVREFHRDDASRSGGGSHQHQQSSAHCPAVVPLNVGGVCYITRRNTLLKEADSMLAATFSGRHEMQKDKHGYYFIDSNGAYFGYILDYLRHGKLPPNDAALPVYQEAGYFGLAGLQEALALTPSVARELVRRRHEDQFPDYGRLRASLIAAAMELAVATRCADLVVWPHKGQATPQHASCVAETAHVKVGPWAGPADEDTLMRTLHADLTEAGFSLAPLEKKRCKFFVSGQTCTRLAYKLAFKFI